MPRKLTKLFTEFFESEQSSGIILGLCTVAAILLANSLLGKAYLDFLHAGVGFEWSGLQLKYSIEHWINDGLMAIFFLLIGLEIERELYIGELSDVKSASLPIIAALGGMAMPALCHFLLNRGTVTQSGLGIPMATDIAFALGVLALLGSKAPASLKIFLAALAIADDLGAIIVIALFYTQQLSLVYLSVALALWVGLMIANRLRINNLWFYLLPGVVMWYCMLQSGIHATLTGVLLAFAIPFLDGGETSPSYRLQHYLHKPVAFGIMPIFALANTGITLTENWLNGLLTTNSLGIFVGLFVGKPVGITLFSFLAVKLGVAQLPADLRWSHIVGIGLLGGIGFTMSIFVTLLAFSDSAVIQSSKIAILLTSLLAGTTGFLWLNRKNLQPAI